MVRVCTTPFWDKNITNLPHPYLTECFRDTALQWFPMGIFWLILPVWLWMLHKRKIQPRPLPISALLIVKGIFTVLFLIVQIVRIINYVLQSNDEKSLANLISPILYIITLLTILWLMNYDRRKGMFCSGLLFGFWLLVCLAIIPDVIDYSIDYKQGKRSIRILKELIRVWLHLIFGLGSFILNCLAERYDFPKLAANELPIVPELYKNFLSRITYSWVTPLIRRGYKKPLTEDDCWQLQISERAVNIVYRVQACLDGTISQAKSIADKKSRFLNKQHIPDGKQIEDESHDLLNDVPLVDVKKKPVQRRKPTIFWRALFHAYKGKIIAGGLMKVVQDILQFTGPVILKWVLKFLEDRTNPLWLGVFYAILLGAAVFCQTLFLQSYFHRQYIVGLRFRSAITALVYRKSLKLSNSAKQETTTGEIVNLMSIDAARFGELTSYLHVLWSGPFQIILALVLLYRQMQLAIIPGVILLLLLIPLNLYLQRIIKQLTTKQMGLKDQRIKMMNELLNGIKVLKLYAWEVAFIRRVNDIREKELICLRKKAIVTTISSAAWSFAPILVCITTFATYVLSSKDNILTAEKAFVSLALFNLLRFPLVVFPSIINSIVEAKVSNDRIQKFLNLDEIDEYAVNKGSIDSEGNIIKIENGSFRWSNSINDPLILKNINLKIRPNTLVALVGTVGSGKSSILAALLGEMCKDEGEINVNGTVAYVPQTAWILNATLKQNILFGRDFNEKLYNQVIEACALKPDFDILPQGDATEIGEKGINLSGGQRQRVSLARALYSEADIYLLDDPLSAVDAHVGAHIFKRAIGPKGLLSNKTRLLVTHGVSHLHKCNEIIVVSRGEIIDHGPYYELMNKSKILRDLVHSITTEEIQRKSSDAEPRTPLTPPFDNIEDVLKLAQDDSQHETTKPATVEITPSEMKEKLIQKETMETGSVKFNVFIIYIRACTIPLVLIIFHLFSLTTITSLGTNLWLSKWTDESKKEELTTNGTLSSRSKIYGLTIYSILGVCQGLISFLMQLFVYLAAYAASRTLHSSILFGVLRAPMAFFDTTPIGRIINRFAKDIDSVDSALPSSFSSAFGTLSQVLITMIILLYGSWFAIFALIPLAFIFAYIQRIYVASSRQLRRLDSTTRSPVYSNFGETIQGLTSIRAYNVQQRFIDISDRLLDRNQSCFFASNITNRWLAVRLEFIANALAFSTALFSVLMRDRLTAGIVGLTITYTMQITQTLNWLVRMTSDIETNIVSVERINEYADLKPEAPWEIAEKKPPSNWPTTGEIQINNLSTRYRENLELVLKDVTINIQPGEKIGIIGRTGSGKSSLCIALFRIIEPADGEIIIDDIDIRHIGLHDVRSKITIIPQDAVIFAGTVRFNIDPFGNHSDVEIWTALELVHIKERIRFLENGLSYLLTEGGENLSAGERQLLCMARALLRKSKIFVLDEATAAIDMETDRLIQMTIRTAFKHATVLTIAHRLHTIIDSTKILVLSNGRVQEYDEPGRLAANPESTFSKLLHDANIQFPTASSNSG